MSFTHKSEACFYKRSLAFQALVRASYPKLSVIRARVSGSGLGFRSKVQVKW
jgi:hypothetical protein